MSVYRSEITGPAQPVSGQRESSREATKREVIQAVAPSLAERTPTV